MEYEPDRPVAADNQANANTNAETMRNGVGALADIIRSRDFVIDFPRIFVLEAGGVTGTHASLFPERLPERSQSSINLNDSSDCMSVITNRLGVQHGMQPYLRQNSNPNEALQVNMIFFSGINYEKYYSIKAYAQSRCGLQRKKSSFTFS